MSWQIFVAGTATCVAAGAIRDADVAIYVAGGAINIAWSYTTIPNSYLSYIFSWVIAFFLTERNYCSN